LALDHAYHNESACEYLLESGKFNDWVVTTAFYAAQYFVLHAIFPCEIQGVNYKDFQTYFSKCVEPVNRKAKKHKAIVSLVTTHLSLVQAEYTWLYTECMTARYNSYKVSDSFAQRAWQYMQQIKNVVKQIKSEN
jgi:hypothetical protein